MRERDVRRIVAGWWTRTRRQGDLAELGVGDRLEVAALGVGGPAVVGLATVEGAAVAAEDVDQAQLLDGQLVDPERALRLAPDAGVEVHFVVVEAVEDDLYLLPVLGRLHSALGEVSARPPCRRRWRSGGNRRRWRSSVLTQAESGSRRAGGLRPTESAGRLADVPATS